MIKTLSDIGTLNKNGLPGKVAFMRLCFHANMLAVVNIGNQLGIIPDKTADRVNWQPFKKIINCLDLMGLRATELMTGECGKTAE